MSDVFKSAEPINGFEMRRLTTDAATLFSFRLQYRVRKGASWSEWQDIPSVTEVETDGR